jgi:hypothetical protein
MGWDGREIEGKMSIAEGISTQRSQRWHRVHREESPEENN